MKTFEFESEFRGIIAIKNIVRSYCLAIKRVRTFITKEGYSQMTRTTVGGSGHSVGRWSTVVGEILDRLGALEHMPLRRTEMGEFGPIYGLTKIDNNLLPEPKIRQRDVYVGYKTAKASWAEATEVWA